MSEKLQGVRNMENHLKRTYNRNLIKDHQFRTKRVCHNKTRMKTFYQSNQDVYSKKFPKYEDSKLAPDKARKYITWITN